MKITIELEGYDLVAQELKDFPEKLDKAMGLFMEASLKILWNNVPPYPPEVVPKTVYKRRVSAGLGGSLGSGLTGGMGGGRPDIYNIVKTTNGYEGRFGTKLSYAPYVIGSRDAPKGYRQAYMHRPGYKGRQGWWVIDDILENSKEEIMELWKTSLGEFLA